MSTTLALASNILGTGLEKAWPWPGTPLASKRTGHSLNLEHPWPQKGLAIVSALNTLALASNIISLGSKRPGLGLGLKHPWPWHWLGTTMAVASKRPGFGLGFEHPWPWLKKGLALVWNTLGLGLENRCPWPQRCCSRTHPRAIACSRISTSCGVRKK